MSVLNRSTLMLVLLFGCASSGPHIECDDEHCYCENGEDIPLSWLCDGDNDCGDWADERGCPGVKLPDIECDGFEYTCRCSNGVEIDSDYLCDGDNDCGNGQDERGCPDRDDDDDYSGGGSGSGTGNMACWDCYPLPCTLYYAPYCY